MEIKYPFLSSVHPLSKEIDGMVIDWAKEIGLLDSKEKVNNVLQMKINWFSSCLYPKADKTLLIPISKLFLILFLLDDYIDDLEKPVHYELVFPLHKDFFDILHGEKVKLDNPMSKAFLSFCTDWQAIVGKDGFKVFTNNFEEYINFQLWEIGLNTKMEIPEINEYCRNRLYASGAYLAVYFLREMNNLNTLDNIPFAIQLSYLETKATSLICLANDLASFSKEFNEGSFNNIVIILIKKYGLSTKRATQLANKKHDRILFQFNQLCALVENSPDPRLVNYMESLRSMIVGSNHWSSMETNRYHNLVNGNIFWGRF